MLVRPFRTNEAVWTSISAVALVVFGLLPSGEAVGAVREGVDVYLFLIGMMLLAGVALACGLFDWLAGIATNVARGSAVRLFTIVYLVCVGVTTFFSNDATAVVLTPVVAATTSRAKVDPLPALFACAFVANAASFVLPISNPANLVIYGNRLPSLVPWLGWYLLPSIASIAVTYAILRWTCRDRMRDDAAQTEVEELSPLGRRARLLIVTAAVALVAASFRGLQIGLATIVCALAVLLIVALTSPRAAVAALRQVDVGVLLLVAGLFVIVAALDRAGALTAGRDLYAHAMQQGAAFGKFAIGAGLTLACNVMNNLPVALGARYALAALHDPGPDVRATMIAVDLGPNLTLTGSLATLLWIAALRKAGIEMTAWRFSRTGILVAIPALAAALATIR